MSDVILLIDRPKLVDYLGYSPTEKEQLETCLRWYSEGSTAKMIAVRTWEAAKRVFQSSSTWQVSENTLQAHIFKDITQGCTCGPGTSLLQTVAQGLAEATMACWLTMACYARNPHWAPIGFDSWTSQGMGGWTYDGLLNMGALQAAAAASGTVPPEEE